MTDLNQEFDSKAREIFDMLMERNPGWATQIGIHKYDDRLTDMSREKMLKDIELEELWLHELRRFDKERLSEERKIDLEALVYSLELTLYQDSEIRNWQRNPYLVVSFLDHIEPLFRKDFAPLDERIRLITKRVFQVDEFIKQTRTLIGERPERLWSEMAMDACREAQQFLHAILNASSESGQVSESTIKSLAKAIEKAEGAIRKYRGWIEEEIKPKAVDQWAIGRERFERLLEKRLLGMNSDRILSIGENLFKEKREKLEEIARKVLEEEGMRPSKDAIEEARKIVEEDHPKTFPEALETYRRSIQEARQFVIDHNLATIPEGENLIIMETPSYLRPIIPLAAYIPPGRLEEKQEGYYLVTPQEEMSNFNYPNIANTTVHEGYPGHHLQLSCANHNPRLARALVGATEMVEGWAHYCEEMVKEHGYQDNPKTKFVQVNDEIWRAVRIILDVRMHRGEMSIKEAIRFLMKEASMRKNVATGEVNRYTFTPTYQLSYLLGKLLIKELKDKVRKLKGDRFDEKKFHDSLLYAGSLPLKLMEKELGIS